MQWVNVGRLLWAATVLLSVSLVLGSQRANAADSQPRGWHNAHISPGGAFCFDSLNPHILLSNSPAEALPRTVAYNWVTGDTKNIADRHFDVCGNNGWVYASNPNGTALRIGLAEPQGRTVAHTPALFSNDGSAIYTAVQSGHMWSSSDDGVTWQQQTVPSGSTPDVNATLVLSPDDARALYVLVVNHLSPNAATYTVYFSADGGVTWQRRASGQAEGGDLFGSPFLTLTALKPVGTLELSINSGIQGSSNSTKVYISGDGARTFNPAGVIAADYSFTDVATAAGILRLSGYLYHEYSLSLSTDSGKTWRNMPIPYPFHPDPSQDSAPRPTMYVSPAAPDVLYMSASDGSGQLWQFSPNGPNWNNGAWGVVGDNLPNIRFSPYVPLSILAYDNADIYVLDGTQNFSLGLTKKVGPSGAANGLYFPQTGHNMSPIFRHYWEANGGLAQFGYPRTEPFRELNPDDGHFYTVQYFERARFEYHPDAPPAYRIMLGLLGSQQIARHRLTGMGPFNRYADAHYPGGIYFPQTGHNLRNGFKSYWDTHGGLAIFGYPISEEFYELNLDDGQTYAVQYFERNRFEWHPQNVDTPYTVLLGLLGTATLRDRAELTGL